MNMTSDTATDKPASTTYPVFKGLGRKPTFFGVPTTLLFGAFMVVAVITMLAGLAWWGLLLVILPTIAIVIVLFLPRVARYKFFPADRGRRF
jgi:type IV secretory pathway VirB3-like protein